MDQSSIVYGSTTSPLMYIEFHPTLNVTCLQVPFFGGNGAQIIVCNSYTIKDKAIDASMYFNKRVVECKLCANMLSMHLCLKTKGKESFQMVSNLGEVEDVYHGCYPEVEKGEIKSKLVEICRDMMKDNGEYSLVSICDELGIQLHGATATDVLVNRLVKDILLDLKDNGKQVLIDNAGEGNSFKPWQRGLHVYSESLRVLELKEKLENVTCTLEERERCMMDMGIIMNLSHESCRDLYECSAPGLDKIHDLTTEINPKTREPLALGTRLTGAGWGGCAISLVRDENVPLFMELIENKFYREFLGKQDGIPDGGVFCCGGGGGAQLLTMG